MDQPDFSALVADVQRVQVRVAREQERKRQTKAAHAKRERRGQARQGWMLVVAVASGCLSVPPAVVGIAQLL